MAGKQHLRSLPSCIDSTVGQFTRYAVIGAVVNISGYLLYLWLTFIRLDPKAAATISFAVGMAVGFVLQRNWTFRNRGHLRQSLAYFAVAYAVAYATNIGGLYILVDILRYPHQIVQLVLILSIACGLFIAQKFWVFR